jgi:hypothetical protein
MSLEDKHLTMPTLMNFRAFGPREVGLFPHGTPAYLVFSTDRICFLLKR